MQVEWASSLREALDKLDEYLPNAILSDLHLEEGYSSVEIFAELRAKAPEAGLVAYSGTPPEVYLEEVDAYLPKNGITALSLQFVLRKAVENRNRFTRLKDLELQSSSKEQIH